MNINTNAIHNALNIVSMVLAGLTAALLFSGCVDTGVALDCSKSWINPAYTTAAVAAIQFVKMGINVIRDGFSGLIKQQPPVQ